MLARFEAEREAELSFARLRRTSAIVLAVGSLAVLLGRVPVAVFLVGALGLALSLAWLVQARRSARRARDPGATYLAVHAHGLEWADGFKAPIWVAWNTVSELDVDEEHLDVRVSLKGASPLHIEPRYPGVEIHELVRTLRNAWQRSDDFPEA
ncbi:MAG: hypothetical protein QM778_08265 [Myxococcales bacterium]